ncbi:YifB family Mg chelatase-like AAA ATPase [Psychrosphaera haliotis]|uniref:YifB family Mg chelatase-like AAA ATPase n=1 Tax=Psychrosphaera haliotis TaxID=555083 RepID=UPI0031D390BC
MSLAIIFSRARVGINAPLVTIEVHLSNGLPSFTIVGLPETSVREAKDRVRSAIINSGLEFPQRRITVNLAPADLPKDGGRFDLAIAIGILAASKQISDKQLYQYEFLGELGLNGDIRTVIGEIPSAIACKKRNRINIMPSLNAVNATIINGAQTLSANSLRNVVEHFKNEKHLCQPEELFTVDADTLDQPDIADVIGQPLAKRALVIAAAGQHNIVFTGPPGTGKSMLAQRIASLMPELSDDEALELAAINSVSGKTFDIKKWRQRPFRSPHHTASAIALTGGGRPPRPGEISLAHNGILFLDELPEFNRFALDALREPLESGVISISRAALQVEFPAQFQLVAALNPSPTGHHTDGRANSAQVLKYLNRISGPFLDRIELQVDVPALPQGAINAKNNKDDKSSAYYKEKISVARELMIKRANKPNGLLSSKETALHCKLDTADAKFLEDTIYRLNMSIRAYHKILKVARTIADLEGCQNINRTHLSEALGYRSLERLLKQLSNF